MHVPRPKSDPPPRDGGDRMSFSKFAAHAIKIPGRLDIASLHGRSAPERRWVADGLLPEGHVTLLGGAGGLGKSVLALQAQAACALDRPWLGRPARKCKSVGLYCEDDADEIWRRLEAIARHYGASVADLAEHVEIFARPDLGNLLMTWPDQYGLGETTELYDQLHNFAVDFGAELLVWDSLHDVFGGNENNRSHARQFIGAGRAIAAHLRGAVLITMHPSLTGLNTGSGSAGSTAWSNACRSRLYLTEPKTEDGEDQDGASEFRELRVKKSNYSPPGGKIRLRWSRGVFVPEDAPGVGPGAVASIERHNAEQALLDGVASFAEQGVTVSHAKTAPNFAPRAIAKTVHGKGHTAADLDRALWRLLESGGLKVVEEGPPSRRRSHLAVVAEKPDQEETP